MLDQRGQLLRAALGFAGLPRPSYDRALWALRFWLNSWRGIGDVERGMERQGFDLQLTRDDGTHREGRAPSPVGDATLNRYGTWALVLSPAAEIWKVPATVLAV